MLRKYPQASRVLPQNQHWNNGTYFHAQGHHYYYPQPAVVVGQVTLGNVASQDAAPQEPVEIEFGGYVHIAELAEVMPLVTTDLCLDMHYNYVHNDNYVPAYRIAYGMLTAVRAMQASFEADDRNAVSEYLIEADRLLYELTDQSDGWTRQQKKQIGETDLATKLEIVGDMTVHAFYDVGISQEPQEDLSTDSVAADDDQTELAPPPE
jgi:hypothetical protein